MPFEVLKAAKALAQAETLIKNMRHFFAEMPHNLQFYRAVLGFIDNVICHQRIIFSLDINFYGLDLFLSAIAIGFLAHLRDLGKGILENVAFNLSYRDQIDLNTCRCPNLRGSDFDRCP